MDNTPSNRDLVKAKVKSYVLKYFGAEIEDLLSQEKFRANLYDESFLVMHDIRIAEYNIEKFIYEKSDKFPAGAFEKAKYWSKEISREQNYYLSASDIMRTFTGEENLLFSEYTTVQSILSKLLANPSLAIKINQGLYIESLMNDNILS